MRFRSRRRRDDVSLDMAPLIDIIFQLLIFFLVTTTFVSQAQNAGLDVSLPSAKTSRELSGETKEVPVALTRDGRLVLKGRAISLDELRAELKEIVQKVPDALLVVQADKEVPHGRVVEVMDVARQLGLSRLAIAAQVQ